MKTLALSLLVPLPVALGFGCGGVKVRPSGSPKQRYDFALERFYAHDFSAAASQLHELAGGLPEGDAKRDGVAYHLAAALSELGFTQAAAEGYIEIIGARRSPELVGRSLSGLETLSRGGLVDADRLADEVLFGGEYGELPPEAHGFVEFHQALAELRRDLKPWATARLESLAKSDTDTLYGAKARYALAVVRLSQDNTEGAQTLLRALLADAATARAVRSDARRSLARLLYERRLYAEALELYRGVEGPLPERDVVLLEKSWAQLSHGDARRALGSVLGLDAPVYRRLFAPERMLVRALAMRDLCQFRLAHLSVLAFRHRYAEPLETIRAARPLATSESLREAALRRDDLVPQARWGRLLKSEAARLGRIKDVKLRTRLTDIYRLRLAHAEAASARQLDRALEDLAGELLRVDEQMTILDYELALGMFRPVSRDEETSAPARRTIASAEAAFRFDGEYWSDELEDFAVMAEDRCVR